VSRAFRPADRGFGRGLLLFRRAPLLHVEREGLRLFRNEQQAKAEPFILPRKLL